MTGTTLRLWDGYPHTSSYLRDEVKKLQAALNQTGRSITEDGYFGHDTDDAVKSFQSDMNLVVDGIAGPKTWRALGQIENGGNTLVTATFETNYATDSRILFNQLVESGQYLDYIEAGAQEAGVPVAVLWGIGSRESGWGQFLRPMGPHGTGDFIVRRKSKPWRANSLPTDGGFGRGLMQIDYDAHEFARSGDWRDPERNIMYGAQVLENCLSIISRRYQEIDRELLLRAGVAAYNCGPGNVLKAIDQRRSIDYYTAGRDYSKDVLSRAGWFQLHGWGC